jgi:hypothetical protein
VNREKKGIGNDKKGCSALVDCAQHGAIFSRLIFTPLSDHLPSAALLL